MTIAGYLAEKAALAALFRDNWTETQIAWPGQPFKTPDFGATAWVEFNVINGEASQVSVGAPGENVFRHPGIVSLMIYVPPLLGEDEALRLADVATAIFRGVTSIVDLRFGAPSINKMGVVANYIQCAVSVPFNRDSSM